MGMGRSVLIATVCLGTALIGTACDDPFQVRDGDFTVTAETGGFRVSNRSPIFESAQVFVEQRASALFDPAPCQQWSGRLAPGGERFVPHGDVVGYVGDADTAYVYWCQLSGNEAVDGGFLTLPFR
jgi:hypothetical protein